MCEGFRQHELLIAWETLLIFACVFADRLQQLFRNDPRLFALCDSFIHGAVAFLSWAVFISCSTKPRDLLQCFICGIVAMAVDTDHFLAARSFTLKKALSLPSRPPFHCTTIVPVIAFLLYFFCRLISSKQGVTLSLLFTIAWLSHHLRDGLRRGVWFYPIGSTQPLHFGIYVLLTATLPVVFRIANFFAPHNWTVTTPNIESPTLLQV